MGLKPEKKYLTFFQVSLTAACAYFLSGALVIIAREFMIDTLIACLATSSKVENHSSLSCCFRQASSKVTGRKGTVVLKSDSESRHPI